MFLGATKYFSPPHTSSISRIHADLSLFASALQRKLARYIVRREIERGRFDATSMPPEGYRKRRARQFPCVLSCILGDTLKRHFRDCFCVTALQGFPRIPLSIANHANPSGKYFYPLAWEFTIERARTRSIFAKLLRTGWIFGTCFFVRRKRGPLSARRMRFPICHIPTS